MTFRAQCVPPESDLDCVDETRSSHGGSRSTESNTPCQSGSGSVQRPRWHPHASTGLGSPCSPPLVASPSRSGRRASLSPYERNPQSRQVRSVFSLRIRWRVRRHNLDARVRRVAFRAANSHPPSTATSATSSMARPAMAVPRGVSQARGQRFAWPASERQRSRPTTSTASIRDNARSACGRQCGSLAEPAGRTPQPWLGHDQ